MRLITIIFMGLINVWEPMKTFMKYGENSWSLFFPIDLDTIEVSIKIYL